MKPDEHIVPHDAHRTGRTYGPWCLGTPLEDQLLGVQLDFEGGLDGAVFDPGDAGLTVNSERCIQRRTTCSEHHAGNAVQEKATAYHREQREWTHHGATLIPFISSSTVDRINRHLDACWMLTTKCIRRLSHAVMALTMWRARYKKLR